MKKLIDKKLFAILLGYMGAYHVVYVAKRVFLKSMQEEGYLDLSWWDIIFAPILGNFIVVPPVILVILLVTKPMIKKKTKWGYIFGLHFVFYLFYVVLICFNSSLYVHFVYNDPLHLFDWDGLRFFLYSMNLNFLGYVGFVTIIYTYYYIQQIAKTERQKVLLSQQLQTMKMELLKSQLNPHFLFNTLNGIAALIKEDADKAQRLIGNLGDLLREVLLLKDEHLIPLEKEMVILDKYLEIMQTRFSDHLSIEIIIEDSVRHALVPSMLVQPILENSFKYGYGRNTTDLEVTLSAIKKEDSLFLTVRNNGMPIGEVKEGTGLKNIRNRLETLYRESFHFVFENNANEKGVVTTIEIPFQVL